MDRSSRQSKGPLLAALLGNSLIAAAKFTAAAFTGSSAMISEGVHSVVDLTNNLLMLLGIRRSHLKPDRQHPFGHGKELYFWSLIVAVMIFGVGGGISIYEGMLHLLNPVPLEDPRWNYAVLSVAFVADSVTLVVAYREFKPTQGKRSFWQAIHASKDPTKFTVLLEDTAGTLGVLTAAVGVFATQMTGNGHFDGAASIGIGLMLCAVAVVLAIESKGLLLGEAADPAVVSALRKILLDDPDVKEVASLLTMHLGPYELLLNVAVEFERGLSGESTAAAISRLERALQLSQPQVKRVFIEARNLQRTASLPK